MWLLFAFGSAAFAGLTAILGKIGVTHTDATLATAVRTFVVLIFAWLMVWITGANADFGSIPPKTLIFLILSGLATGASWLCYFYALQKADVSKVVAIDKSSTIMTMLLAAPILGESITPLSALSMVIMGTGTWLMICKKNARQDAVPAKNQWLLAAFASAVFAALTSILGKIGVESIDSTLGTAIRTCVVLVMAWLMVAVKCRRVDIRAIARRDMVFIILSGLATGASWLCFYRALQTGDASVVVPVDKLSILAAVGFSYLVFGEKLSPKALLGLFLLTAGTLLLVIGRF